MPSILYPPGRPQSIGEVLDTAFRIFSVSLLKVLPYSVLATIASQIPNIYVILSGGRARNFGNGDPMWWVLYVAGTVLGCGFFNAIILRQFGIASGRPTTASAALLSGLRRTPANFTMAITVGLVLGLCVGPIALLPASLRFWAVLAAVAPVAYVLMSVFSAWPAVVVARKGPFESIRYSVNLSRGNRWRTVMVCLVMVSMILVLSVTAGLVVGVLTQVVAARDLAVTTAVTDVMVVASGAVYIPLSSAMWLALFGDLQARREGIDLERRIAGTATS